MLKEMWELAKEKEKDIPSRGNSRCRRPGRIMPGMLAEQQEASAAGAGGGGERPGSRGGT